MLAYAHEFKLVGTERTNSNRPELSPPSSQSLWKPRQQRESMVETKEGGPVTDIFPVFPGSLSLPQ
jgi:hypothetical protein